MTLRRLPLFPLPLVLFPGVPLPLHIFEPRYRRLLADCLEGDREFGLIYRPEHVEERDLEAGRVGCVAHVEERVPLPDGRADILVTGRARFELAGFLDDPAPYHVAEVRDAPDLPDDDAEALAAAAGRLRTLFESVGAAARTIADERNELPELPEDPALLSFRVASVIDLDADARQALLAERSPLARLAQLRRLLERARGPLEERAAVHERAKKNGAGPGHHA